MDWLANSLHIVAAAILVAVNGFFVAAEFALVKVRGSRLDLLVKQRRPFANSAKWLAERMDDSLSACQLGITMASLGLGWVGEPAFARIIEPLFGALGIVSEPVLHAASFTFAFTLITALHLIIGEQAPKIFAIRRPERLVLWCAVPLRAFYVVAFPLLIALSVATTWLLRRIGVEQGAGHEAPLSEEELLASLRRSQLHGEVTQAERQLIEGVFEFDELICRRVMVPRRDVVFFDIQRPVAECVELAKRTKHTRYPLCDGSMDHVLGIVHIKDLVGVSELESMDLRSLMRPARRVPETMPIGRLLRYFQATHQLMAVVIDEHGTVVGIATLENVLEPIIGPVEDEFDTERPEVVPDGHRRFIVLGGTPLEVVNRKLQLNLESPDVDTFSGLLMQLLGRIPQAGDRVQLDGAVAEVLEARGARASRTRVILQSPQIDPSVAKKG